MITREEAAAYADGDETALLSRQDLARTVVALHDEVERLTNLLRLAESSVSLLRADLAHRGGQVSRLLGSVAEANTEASDLRLELRRLRAAEAPGTDNAAFFGSGWRFSLGRQCWVHKSGATVTRGPACATLDAMRAAVPGSV